MSKLTKEISALEESINQKKWLINTVMTQMKSAGVILETYKGDDPRQLQQHEEEELNTAMESYQHASRCLLLEQKILKDLEGQLGKLKIEVEAEKKAAAGNDDASIMELIDLVTQQKLLDLKNEYESTRDKFQWQIEDLEEAMNDEPTEDGKQKHDRDLRALRRTLGRCNASYDKNVEQIKEVGELEKKRTILETRARSDQLKSPKKSEVRIGQDRTEDWVQKTDGVYDDQSMSFAKTEKTVSPLTSEYGTARNQEPAVDKDAMMIALMQSHVAIMQKPQSSFSDRKLPEFTGDPSEWGPFKSAWDRKNKKHTFEDSENLARLQFAIKGKAKETVKHLMTTPNNIQKIIQVLEQRYGRPEYIIDYLMEKVRTCKKPEVTKPESIVDFGTAVDNLVTNIQAYDENEYMHNKQLVNELVEKMPGMMKGNWFRWLNTDKTRKVNLINFSLWLEEETAIATLQLKPVIVDGKKEERRERGNRSPGSFNATEVSEATSSHTCSFCKKAGHDMDVCFKFKKKTVDERWTAAKEAKVCFGCLKLGHLTKDCKTVKECGTQGCQKRHNPLLHSTAAPARNENSTRNAKVEKIANSTEAENVHDETESRDGVIGLTTNFIKGTDGPLPIVPVRVRGINGNIERVCYALLDSGCTRTLIKEELARILKLDGEKIQYRYRVFAGNTVRNEDAMKVNFEICGRYQGAKRLSMHNAVTVKNIGLSPFSMNVAAIKLKWPHLQRYKGPSLQHVVPDIVVGGDHGYLMMHKELLYSSPEEPVAMRTMLGWIMMGKLSNTNVAGAAFAICGEKIETLDNLIRESYKLEDYGVKGDGEKKMSLEDKRAVNILESTTHQRSDGRWETGLLWKDEVPFPENSYDEAYVRLSKTEARMRKDPEYAKVYQAKIEEYTIKKYITKIDENEEGKITGRTYFLPHFGVVNANKPGKFRLVFDAAAKTDGMSMNDRLLTGPDLLRPLPAVLWNFRCHQFVVCGDVEDMFHRVVIRKEDRVAQQFLWRNGNSNVKPNVYQMDVMIFGATSSPSTAIYIKDKNADTFQTEYPEAVLAIKSCMYCDDFLGGANTVEDAIRLRKEVTLINKSGGFYMKKWISNSEAVMASIPDDLRLDGNKPLVEQGLWNLSTERVLGLWWDPQRDEFTFKLNFNKVKPEVLAGRTPTKREMCGLIMSLFDPIGFVGHFKIKGLILFQQVWKSGVEWDDYIPADIMDGWSAWLDELRDLPNIKISRCYSISLEKARIQLHTITDASSEAMASICYLRIDTGQTVDLVFVSGKVRVAPLKKSTIPRLELEAAVIGCKLASTVAKELKVTIDRRLYWTDSSTVMYWVCSESSRFKEYVANRVSKIQDLSSPSEWKWIPTSENAADDGTRSAKQTDLSSDCRWLRGPAFLYKNENEWPVPPSRQESVVAAVATEETISPATDYFSDNNSARETTPCPSRFSSYYRLVRASAAVIVSGQFWLNKARLKLKMISKMERQVPWNKFEGQIESNLTTEDLVLAQKMLMRLAQANYFQTRKKNQNLKYELFKDPDGVLRVKSRLGNADCIEESTKTPIFLPTKHPITDLIIDEEHRRNLHFGRNTVFNNLRLMYWIEDGRHAVRRSWTRCLVCRLKRAKPKFPEMGILPNYRVAGFEPPFTYTGADMFGPIEVSVGRRHEKRWGLILTCMVTRAIHLETTCGLSLDETLLAVSRFVDCRGLPRHFYTDNGTNFQALAKEVKKRQKFHMADWHFIPPASPHMGGAWESMVKQVKSVLCHLLKSKYPRDQELQTAFKAVENIVNSRPLSYVSSDANDCEALTPNHFIRGVGLAVGSESSQASKSGSEYFGEDVSDDKQRYGKLWEKSQVLANQFWQRWSKEVLPDLIRRNKWNSSTEPVVVGDVVIMVDEQKPRKSWAKGIVSKTFPGKDGVTRVVDVVLTDIEGNKRKTYRRAVTKVCPTGIRCCDLESTLNLDPKSGGRKC